ncbi:MAG: HAMP domain-containing sensor histidine kinase [Chloroflexota bacterium]
MKQQFNFLRASASPDTTDNPLELLLSRRLVVIFGIVAFAYLLFKIMLEGPSPAAVSATIILPPLLLAVYTTSRLQSAVAARVVTFLFIGVAIVFFAASAQPPHVEIIYLLMLPLVSSVFLSARLTGYMGMVAVILHLGFAALMESTMPQDVATDLLGVIILSTVLLVAIGWQRGRYEAEQRRMALEAQRIEVMETVLRSISHDFRTPLTIIETTLYLLEQDTSDASRTRRVDQIRAQVWRLNKMVDEILDAARQDTATTLPRSQANIAPMVTSRLEDFKPVAAAKDVTVVVHTTDTVPDIWCHPPSIERVLVNLVENAINYCAPGDTVTVSVSSKQDCAILRVQDTGIGIAADQLPHIFEPFYRANVARSARTGGNGLGLAIVKRIVNEHHGRIDVESVLGQGTTFNVAFPSYGQER